MSDLFTCLNALITSISSWFYVGDLEDEDEVLSWLNEDSTLEIPGKIEEVNTKMLDKILNETEHVVVFFCKYTVICLFLPHTILILTSSFELLNENMSKYLLTQVFFVWEM